jgi:hypothetical protein
VSFFGNQDRPLFSSSSLEGVNAAAIDLPSLNLVEFGCRDWFVRRDWNFAKSNTPAPSFLLGSSPAVCRR